MTHTAKPATPLCINGSETTTAIWIEDANGTRIATIKNCATDADIAAYIVESANAYPRLLAEREQLVAALLELAEGGAAMGWSSADRARALLRALGESQ